MSKTLQRSLKKNIPNGLNGSEWDSSDEEEEEPPVMSKQKIKTTSTKSKGGKIVKYDDSKKGDNDEEKDLVLYIGHLPKDFEELDLRRFLSQFGKVYNCRVARKMETGKPKGFAFVRFGDEETTKIVCNTLHGYFLEKQRLVCQLRPSHPGMFFDTEKIIDKRLKKKQLEARQRNRNLTNSEKLKAITSRLVTREMKKRERLEALGIEYDFPGYKSNRADFEEEFIPEGETNQTEADEEASGENANKKKRRKESMDSTNSQGSATKEKKKKKERKESVDSTNSQGSATKEKKKKAKKRKDSIDSIASIPSIDGVESEKVDKKKKKKKRSSL